MSSFGERLREERKRLNVSQDVMAATGGVQRGAQINYEAGKRSPDWDYLALVAAAGVDVQYVLTGKVSAAELATDENELLRGYRGLDIRGKAGVLGMIDGMSAPQQPAAVADFVVHGNVKQQLKGDIYGNNIVGMPGKKKKKTDPE